jgi:hypothetical protein
MTIAQLVHREQKALFRVHVAATIAVSFATLAALLAIASVTLGGARWMTLPRVLPFVIWLVIIAAIVAGWMLLLRIFAHEATLAKVSTAVEREQSLRAGSVRGTMEVADSGSLGRKAADAMLVKLNASNGTLVPQTRRQARRRLGRIAAVLGVAIIALSVSGGAFVDGFAAVMSPVDAWRGTLLPAISFENLPPAVVRGEPLRLHILAKGRREITVERRATGEGWHSDRLVVDDRGQASLDLGPMTADIHLAATDGRSATDTMIVKVADRPFLGGIAMRAIYPAYLGREAEGLAIGEAARVPAGTVIEISGRASTELNEVKLVSESSTNGNDVNSLTPLGHAFRGRFAPRASGSWRWVAAGVSGPVSDAPPPLSVEVIPDSLPRVEIVSPMNDTLVAPGAKVTLRMAAMDDHGLASIDIVSWPVTNGKAGERASVKVAERPGAIWGTSLVLDVAGRGLEAGDVLHLKVAATDNSPWTQRGESRELLVRVATSEEQRDMARATGDSAVAAADAAVKAQKALERRAADAAQDRASAASGGKDEKMSFEAAQKAKALAEDQHAMAEQVKQLSQVAKALEQQLREAGALDSSLARQLQEAQAMLREALTPEMLEQMKKLEQGAQELSKGDVQESLAALKEQQRRMREQLEKSAEMLRRAAMEGSMQTMTDEARELAKKQRELGDSSAAKSDASKQQTAKDLADRTDRLEKQMEKLQERLDNAKATTGAAKTGEARQNAQGAEEKLRAGADKSGEAAAKMDKAADAMKEARDGQVKEWKQELTSALDQSIQELLQMSREESSLQQQVKSGAAKGEDARGQQSAIKQGLDAASQRLQKEAQKSSLLSGRSQRAVTEAQQKVDQATQQASDPRTSQQSSQAMNEAAEALNKAAASLARDRERANTASSASGFAEMIQQMQEMAGKQGNINSQAQSLMPQPGSAMSQMAQAQARALARQQRQVADKLDELSDAAAGDKAAKMAQEARQLADALEGSRIDASTLARQQQLFKKMLDAGRSLEKEDREESEKREAKSAVDPKQFTPQAAPGKAKDATRFREPTWDELRGLTADERRIILEYFKKLNGGRGG